MACVKVWCHFGVLPSAVGEGEAYSYCTSTYCRASPESLACLRQRKQPPGFIEYACWVAMLAEVPATGHRIFAGGPRYRLAGWRTGARVVWWAVGRRGVCWNAQLRESSMDLVSALRADARNLNLGFGTRNWPACGCGVWPLLTQGASCRGFQGHQAGVGKLGGNRALPPPLAQSEIRYFGVPRLSPTVQAIYLVNRIPLLSNLVNTCYTLGAQTPNPCWAVSKACCPSGAKQ